MSPSTSAPSTPAPAASPLPSTTISPFTRALLSGALAGTTVDLTLFPLDTIKTRLQSAVLPHPHPQPPLRLSLRGIYAGVGSAFIGSAPGAALFFTTYETTKTALHQRFQVHDAVFDSSSRTRDAIEHMVAASAGEIAACAVRVPTEVIKQRTQTGQHATSLEALTWILRRREQSGMKGVMRELYRGWNATILREVPFTMVQFPVWEGLKRWRVQRRNSNRQDGRNFKGSSSVAVTATESAVFGSIAGAIAAAVTTPLDVVKTRLMLSRHHHEQPSFGGHVGIVGVLKEIMQTNGQGARALFAGIVPRMLWISIGGAIFLGSYTGASNFLDGLNRRDVE